MKLDSGISELNLAQTRSGLVFDADATALVGSFADELGCYRARRSWVEVLNNYFLLERDRDYKLEVISDGELTGEYVLSCNFISACGRYAFWRLINNQAIDAERDLCSGGDVRKQRARSLSWDDEDELDEPLSFPSLLHQELYRNSHAKSRSWYDKFIEKITGKPR